MANNVKPIDKLGFASATRVRRSGAAAGERRTERELPSSSRASVARSTPSAGTARRAPLTIARSAIATATGIAHQLGWLEREAALDDTSLTVQHDVFAASPGLIQDTSPLAQRDALTEPPGLIREGEHVASLWARSHGAATRLIGLTWVDGFQAVVAAPGAAIAEPADLAGRRLALPRDDAAPIDVRRATACRGFDAATGLAGLFCDELRYVDVAVAPAEASEPYGAEVAALLRGEVDAIHVAGAAGAAAAARIGAVTVADLGSHLDPMVRAGAATPATLTASTRLLNEQPQLVVRILAVLLRAGAWAQRHPGDATRLVADEIGVAPDDVTAAQADGWHEQLHVDLSEHKLAALRAQEHFLRTHGFLAAEVDLGAWIDPRPLGAARELLAAERTAWS